MYLVALLVCLIHYVYSVPWNRREVTNPYQYATSEQWVSAVLRASKNPYAHQHKTSMTFILFIKEWPLIINYKYTVSMFLLVCNDSTMIALCR